MSDRPNIRIPVTTTGRVLEALGWLLCLFAFGLVGYFIEDLPAEIPNHYGFSGSPDNYGPKSGLWTLPIIGTAVYVLCIFLSRRPHILNYGVTITPENARRQYRNATGSIRSLSVFLAGVFAFLTLQTIRVALGNAEGLGWYGVAVILLGIFGLVLYSFRKSNQLA